MTQQPRTIFIAGSSSGLGRAAAKLFSARGWKVIATMRSPEKEKELAGLPGVALLPLDITDPEQIERAATKAISGGMKTDFFTRSFDVGRHADYDALVDKVMGVITDPKQMETYSSSEQIAEVVYEAATDGKDQLRYLAGADAKATYATRLQLGDEAFRKAIRQQFFGGTEEGA